VPTGGSDFERALLESKPVQVADVFADPEYTLLEVAKKGGYRTFLGVPLLRDGSPIGVITLARKTVAPFTDKQIELVSIFADQAVIAIENVRLFEAEQERTQALTESLQQQTATADVLKIISRSTFDLPRVLDTLVRSAGSLCEADMAAVLRPQDERFIFAASFGLPQAHVDLVKDMPISASRGTLSGRVMIERRPVHIPDVLADPEYLLSEAQKAAGYRSMLGVPLLREGIPIGIINLLRLHVRPFTDKQIALAQTFADQAVIAIENARLFEAEQARTRELTESLQQQTATADVLKIISRRHSSCSQFSTPSPRRRATCAMRNLQHFLYFAKGSYTWSRRTTPPMHLSTMLPSILYLRSAAPSAAAPFSNGRRFTYRIA
jgi:GAF domain-containing protein